MRCVHTILGMGCGNQAEEGSVLCEKCRKIVYGPTWKDPVLGPLAVFMGIALVAAIFAFASVFLH